VLSSGTVLAADTCKKLSWAVIPLVLLVAVPARGAEVTRVVSAMDGENRFDFNLTASWIHDVKSALVKREPQAGLPPFGTDPIPDSTFSQTRDILDLRADFGILWDVGLHVDLPLVLQDTSGLGFARGVDSASSTVLRDGILPGYQADSWGLDAQHNRPYSRVPGVPVPTNLFQGPTRKGFENLGVGLTWAPFNQTRDDTKPTWTLSFDAKLDVFEDRRFDPANPGGNTAVGQGYHQFVWSTFVSKRFRWFEPYVGGWYMLPVRTNGSPFQKYDDAQTSVNPQQQASVVAGVEQIAWENPRGDQRVTIEARAFAVDHFYGRGRSEIWEPLAGSSQCNVNNQAACRPGIDLDYTVGATDTYPGTLVDAPHPGITDIEAYGTFGGDLGLNVQVGRFIRFRGLFGFQSDMPHVLTAASAGVDKPTKDMNGTVMMPDGRVDLTNPNEANPTYRPAIDQPGRRFRVEGTRIWTLFLQGSMMF